MRFGLMVLAIAAGCTEPACAGMRKTAFTTFKVTLTVVRKCTTTTPGAVSVAAGVPKVSVSCSAKTPYAISLSRPQAGFSSRLPRPADGRARPGSPARAGTAAASGEPLTLSVTY